MYKINCENIGDVKKYIWHYRKGNSEYGPYTYEDIAEMVRNGEIGPDDYVLKFGNKKFIKARDIQGLLDFAPKPEEKQTEQVETPQKEAAVGKDETVEELHVSFENSVTYMQGKQEKEASHLKLIMIIAGLLGLSLAVWLLIRFF